MDLLVREAQPDDAEAIVDIFNPIIEAGLYTAFDAPFTVEAEREYIANFPQRGIFHVAVRREDQRVVGFQNLEPFANYTRGFDHVGIIGSYVELTQRRQGIGRCLFERMFEAARDKEYEKLFTYVRVDNLAALATYLKHGFRVIGTAQKHCKLNGKYVDEFIIEKLL